MSSSTTNPISPPSNYGQFVTVKLTRDNYLLWQAQILPYLQSQRLLGYVTSDIKCPSSTLPATSTIAAPVPNPAYDHWFEQDQAILSAILSSLSPEVLSQWLFLKTSKDVWDKLDGLYVAQSRASAMQLRMQLATLKKQNLSATTDYFNRVKNLADSLVAAGAPVRDDEVVAYILTGLPEEYDSLVTSVTTRAEPMPLGEVYTNLLSFEVRLINRNGGHTLTANYASRGGCGGCHNGRTGGHSGGRSGGRSGGCHNNTHTGDRSNTGDRPRCQICGRPNHMAPQCWYPYDDSYRMDEKPHYFYSVRSIWKALSLWTHYIHHYNVLTT
jgi:hypothetical protein